MPLSQTQDLGIHAVRNKWCLLCTAG